MLIHIDMTQEELLGCYLVVVKFEIMITSSDNTLNLNKNFASFLESGVFEHRHEIVVMSLSEEKSSCQTLS